MSALIPALIQFAVSRMRRGGGGGGGYGGYGGGSRSGYRGGYRGGYGGRSPRPQMSQEEQSDKYWESAILKGSLWKGADSDDEKASDAYLKQLSGIGADTSYEQMMNTLKNRPLY